jgi:hypothetical protein
MSGMPLPFGAIDNRRRIVALDNLVDLIEECLNNLQTINKTFLVSDGDDLSTKGLFQLTEVGLGKPLRLISIPVSLLSAMARLFRKSDFAQRLCGSLQVGISKTQDRLS